MRYAKRGKLESAEPTGIRTMSFDAGNAIDLKAWRAKYRKNSGGSKSSAVRRNDNARRDALLVAEVERTHKTWLSAEPGAAKRAALGHYRAACKRYGVEPETGFVRADVVVEMVGAETWATGQN